MDILFCRPLTFWESRRSTRIQSSAQARFHLGASRGLARSMDGSRRREVFVGSSWLPDVLALL